MPVQKVTPVNCPNCRTRFSAQINNIIDGQDAAMKNAFLQGQLNFIQCPQCGFAGAPAMPIYYYDLEKELAFVFVPTEVTLSGGNQEKIIGDLTNQAVNDLPAEQKKFFLFNPKNFLTMDSMIKAVLEADGITEEMLKAQEAKVKLIEEFLKSSDEDALKEKVKAHDAQLDREFFEILTAYIQTAQMAGDQNRAQTFVALRTMTSRWSSKGREIVAKIDKDLGAMMMENQDDLLERLQSAANDEEFKALIGAGFPLLDYGFFQKLTAKIDKASKQGDSETVESLKALRSKILEAKDQVEEQSNEALQKGAELLKELLQSNDPDVLIRKKIDQFNEAFFFVLQANIDEARRQGHEQPAQGLEALGSLILSRVQQTYGQQPQEESPAEEEVSKPKIEIASR